MTSHYPTETMLDLIEMKGSVQGAAELIGVTPQAVRDRFYRLDPEDELAIRYHDLIAKDRPFYNLSLEELMQIIEEEGSVRAAARRLGCSNSALGRKFHMLDPDSELALRFRRSVGSAGRKRSPIPLSERRKESCRRYNLKKRAEKEQAALSANSSP